MEETLADKNTRLHLEGSIRKRADHLRLLLDSDILVLDAQVKAKQYKELRRVGFKPREAVHLIRGW